VVGFRMGYHLVAALIMDVSICIISGSLPDSTSAEPFVFIVGEWPSKGHLGQINFTHSMSCTGQPSLETYLVRLPVGDPQKKPLAGSD
jgi:hypothetical protein